MKIQKIVLHNFKNYEDGELNTGGFNLIITQNNGTGKTNLLNAIHWCLTGYLLDGSKDNYNAVKYGKDEMFVKIYLEDLIVKRKVLINNLSTKELLTIGKDEAELEADGILEEKTKFENDLLLHFGLIDFAILLKNNSITMPPLTLLINPMSILNLSPSNLLTLILIASLGADGSKLIKTKTLATKALNLAKKDCEFYDKLVKWLEVKEWQSTLMYETATKEQKNARGKFLEVNDKSASIDCQILNVCKNLESEMKASKFLKGKDIEFSLVSQTIAGKEKAGVKIYYQGKELNVVSNSESKIACLALCQIITKMLIKKKLIKKDEYITILDDLECFDSYNAQFVLKQIDGQLFGAEVQQTMEKEATTNNA